MKDLLNFIVSKSTGIKDFKIEENTDEQGVNFVIHAPKDSIGLIIGKGGQTIKSIRNILRVKATLDKKLVKVSVAEAD